MTKIELEIHDDAISTINKIKNINDSGVELVIPQGSVLFENILNLKLITNLESTLGMSIHFTTTDEQGNTLIEMLEEKGSQTFLEEDQGIELDMEIPPQPKKRPKLPKLRFPRLPKIRIKLGFKFLVLLIVLAAAGYFGFKHLSQKPIATAKIYVDTQPLTRSITVRISSTNDTSIQDKVLKGTIVESAITQAETIETTGEKVEGEKAEGKVALYNKTTDEIELKKGKELKYEEDDNDYLFYTKDTVTIPPLAPEAPLDPASPLIPGEKEVEVEADEIGGDYNIEEGESLEVDDYKKSELAAKTKDDFEGGSSETIQVVSEEDIASVRTALAEKIPDTAETELKSKVPKGSQYIAGAFGTQVTSDNLSHEEGDETEELKLEQTVTLTGLTYSEDDLKNFLDKIVAELIPQGFELHQTERETTVDILGNSTNSVLTSTEADVQVTLKTFIIKKVNKDEIVQKLVGKSPEEAEKVLGSLSDVKTYEFSLAPNIPFFGNIPEDPERIIIEVVRE